MAQGVEKIFDRLTREERGVSTDLSGAQMRVAAPQNGEPVLAGHAFDGRGAIATEGEARFDGIGKETGARHAAQLTPPETGQRMNEDDDAALDAARPADEIEKRRSGAW